MSTYSFHRVVWVHLDLTGSRRASERGCVFFIYSSQLVYVSKQVAVGGLKKNLGQISAVSFRVLFILISHKNFPYLGIKWL